MALRKVGALGLKDSKKGGKFMSGILELEGRGGPKVRILVFKNEKKSGDKDPDYTIHQSEDDEPTERATDGRKEEVPL